MKVWFGDQILSGVAVDPGKSGSALVSPQQLTTPRKIPVYLVHTVTGQKIELGTFDIAP